MKINWLSWKSWLPILGGVGGLWFLSGCSFGKKRTSMSFQVAEDSPVYHEVLTAAANWARATGAPIYAGPNGDIPVIIVAKTECPLPPEYEGTGKIVLGCSMDYGTPDARIELAEQNLQFNDGGKQLLINIMHEMGHHLRGNSDHIEAPDKKCAIMAPAYDVCKTNITKDDIEFICQCFECPAVLNG